MSIPQLFRRRSVLISLAVLVVLAGGGVWAYTASRTPERVFWSMIEHNLVTSAVTVESKSETNGSKVHQLVQYSFGAENISRGITHLSQSGTTVTNESVGTPTTDYTRYNYIKTDQKTPAGKPMDFSHVVNVWGKSAAGGSGQLFGQSALGTGLPLSSIAVPIGNLSPQKRQQLLNQMHNDKLFQVDFAKAKTKVVNGRKQYVYDIKMSPVAYASMLKHFAQSIGLHAYDKLDPNTLSGQQSYALEMTVDVRSRHLTMVETKDKSITQTYSAYDVPVQIDVPANAISITELQERIGKAQQ